tara:strand:+ start:168 stop:476 length:309 start_codon:yes stop_codon:yes gene_type:complete
MKRESSLKYLIFKIEDSDKKLAYMFDNNIEHKEFMNFILDTHRLNKFTNIQVVNGGFIDYNKETKQFSTIGKSISCRVDSNPDDINHFILASIDDGSLDYWY